MHHNHTPYNFHSHIIEAAGLVGFRRQRACMYGVMCDLAVILDDDAAAKGAILRGDEAATAAPVDRFNE
jgi:hypothetical protein